MTEDELGASRPDPITVARIDHEISGLKELLVAKDAVVSARLAAMDKAVQLLEKFPTAIDVAISNLKDLHEEKFEGVDNRIKEMNLRFTDAERYKQTALDAALKAAQNLVDKDGLNTKDSMKKMEELFGKQIDSLQSTVDDLKGIVRQGQGTIGGTQSGQAALIGWFVAAVMALLAVGSISLLIAELPRH